MLRSFRSVRLGHSQVRASSHARAEAAAVLCSVHRQQCSVIGQKLHKNRNQQRTCARNGQGAPGTVVDAAAAPGSPATPPRVQGLRPGAALIRARAPPYWREWEFSAPHSECYLGGGTARRVPVRLQPVRSCKFAEITRAGETWPCALLPPSPHHPSTTHPPCQQPAAVAKKSVGNPVKNFRLKLRRPFFFHRGPKGCAPHTMLTTRPLRLKAQGALTRAP